MTWSARRQRQKQLSAAARAISGVISNSRRGLLAAAAVLAGTAATMAPGLSGEEGSPIFGGKIPPEYRDWRLISVAHEEGSLNDIRAILGNDVAIKASREATLPYPGGAIIARLAWSYQPLGESSKAFGRLQSFVAGTPTNLQFMVKDPSKNASTGGWGFAQFDGGKPAAEATQKSCFSCHETVKSRDFVFNRYAP
jgi:Cytochrome P460